MTSGTPHRWRSPRAGRLTWWLALAVLTPVALAACSGPPGPTTASSTGSSATAETSAVSVAENLALSPSVRAQLLSVGARFHGAPVSEYSGLSAGLSYYAYDPSTRTFWAGAKLVPKIATDPNASPTQAEVSAQDEGAYTVFMKARNRSWHAYATGATGQDTRCPVVIPAAVLRVWGWPAGSCRPAGA